MSAGLCYGSCVCTDTLKVVQCARLLCVCMYTLDVHCKQLLSCTYALEVAQCTRQEPCTLCHHNGAMYTTPVCILSIIYRARNSQYEWVQYVFTLYTQYGLQCISHFCLIRGNTLLHHCHKCLCMSKIGFGFYDWKGWAAFLVWLKKSLGKRWRIISLRKCVCLY